MAETSAIATLLARARRGLDRVEPSRLDAEVAAGAVVIDIRSERDRRDEGDLPGAIIVERTVLEWRLDPTSPDRIAAATGPDVRFVIVCKEGYSSSLAASTLRELGLSRATDLVGGYRAWKGLHT